jgi:S1-C subfamily serine protease
MNEDPRRPADEPTQPITGDAQAGEPTRPITGDPQAAEPTQVIATDAQVGEPTRPITGDPQAEPTQVIATDAQVGEPTRPIADDPQAEPTQVIAGAARAGEPTRVIAGGPVGAEPTQVIAAEPTRVLPDPWGPPNPADRVVPAGTMPAPAAWQAAGQSRVPSGYLGETPPTGQQWAAGQQHAGPPQYPGQQQHSGQQYAGQAYPAQPYPGQQFPGQQNQGQQYPGQSYPAQQYPGQQYPGQQYPGQSYPGQYAGQPYPGQQAYPGQYYTAGQYPSAGQYPYPRQGYPQGSYSPQYSTTQPRTARRVTGVVALVLAVVMGVSAFLWASRSATLTIDPLPNTTTQPSEPVQPNLPTSEPQGGEPAGQGQPGEVSAALSAGVVLINAETSEGTAAGTGMVLSADGTVLTNYHVVAGSTEVEVTIVDTGDSFTAEVLGFDQTRDVALLQLDGASGLTTITVDEDAVSKGDAVSAVGNADGRNELTRADGEVTALDRSLTVSSDSPWGATEDLSGMIQTNAGAVPGDSGGPMFDAEGEVLGMTTAGSTREGTSYAVPIASALGVVQTIEAGTDVGTTRVGPAAFLGVKVADTGTSTRGKTVTEVVADSPAAKAGIKAGSTLTEVNGTTITADTNLAEVIRTLEPGARVSVKWIAPNGSSKEAEVTMEASTVN